MSRLLLLLLITALFACKQQDDKLPDFPSELRLTGVRKKNGIRLFVNKTEIYNKAASMQFVDGLEIFRISDSVISSDEKILFFSPDSAFFRRWSPWGLDVRKSGDTLRFKSGRVIEVPNDAILSINPLFKHKMNIVDIGVNLPWSETSWASPILTAYGNYSKLELPGLSYKVVKTDRISSEDRIYQRGFSGKAFNEFDQSYIQTIRSTDTLAIEEYFYIFEKK